MRLPPRAQPSRMRRLMKESAVFYKKWDREVGDWSLPRPNVVANRSREFEPLLGRCF
jgi:hypothetical protein